MSFLPPLGRGGQLQQCHVFARLRRHATLSAHRSLFTYSPSRIRQHFPNIQHPLSTSLVWSPAAARAALTIRAPMAVQTRGHADHGHGHGHHHHHHHHDNVYLTSSNKKDAGVRITRIGLFVNLAMAISKFVGGYIFHSQALIADAYHALTDLVSDFMTLGTVAWSLKPPSERFPNGYGKVESLGALGVSSLLLCGGVFMGLDATQTLLSQFAPETLEALEHAGLLFHGHSHSHSHDGEVLGPNINAIWLAAGSIVVKEWLYRASKPPSLGLIIRSSNICSNENCRGTKVVRSRLERSPPPYRLIDESRRIGYNWRRTHLHQCSLARPCWRVGYFLDGYQCRMDKH